MPGYHLNGTVTSSASCSRARSSSTSVSAMISAPPRTNGTCGAHTAILMSAASARPRAAATRASRSSISRSAAALKERWSYASGSTYQRISLRSTALAGVERPPRTPGRRRRPRSAETGQSRSASARAALRSSAPPASPGAAPERRTSCFSCSKSAARSVSCWEEIPARSPFSAGAVGHRTIVPGSRDRLLPDAGRAQPPHARPRRGRRRGDVGARARPRTRRRGDARLRRLHAAGRSGSRRGPARDRRAGVPRRAHDPGAPARDDARRGPPGTPAGPLRRARRRPLPAHDRAADDSSYRPR